MNVVVAATAGLTKNTDFPAVYDPSAGTLSYRCTGATLTYSCKLSGGGSLMNLAAAKKKGKKTPQNLNTYVTPGGGVVSDGLGPHGPSASVAGAMVTSLMLVLTAPGTPSMHRTASLATTLSVSRALELGVTTRLPTPSPVLTASTMLSSAPGANLSPVPTLLLLPLSVTPALAMAHWATITLMRRVEASGVPLTASASRLLSDTEPSLLHMALTTAATVPLRMLAMPVASGEQIEVRIRKTRVE